LQLYRAIWNTAQRYWTNEKWLRITDDETQKPAFVQLNTLSLDQFGRPVLVNALGALDVDIILEEGPDVASLTQDVYEMLKGYPAGTIPPQVIIEMSPMPRAQKTRIMQMLKPPPNPIQLAAMKTKMEEGALKNVKLGSEARKNDAMAHKALAETADMGVDNQNDALALKHQMWKEVAEVGLSFQQLQAQQAQQQPPQKAA
jgi:hypothetical protein